MAPVKAPRWRLPFPEAAEMVDFVLALTFSRMKTQNLLMTQLGDSLKRISEEPFCYIRPRMLPLSKRSPKLKRLNI